MGMNHPGELAPLVKMTAPEIGVISSIGPAHIEFFANQAAIAAEKAELIAALPPEGLAVLNSDDEWSRRIADRTHARVVWVGKSPIRPGARRMCKSARTGSRFFSANGSAATVRLPVVNRVMVGNALLAAAVGRECGLTMDEIARGLEAVRLPGARMQVVKAHGAWIINDAYNANPDSMKAALVALHEFPGAARRLAVLGSMGELGRHATELHRAVGRIRRAAGLAFSDRGRSSCGSLRPGRDGGRLQPQPDRGGARCGGSDHGVAAAPARRRCRAGQGLALHGARPARGGADRRQPGRSH